MVNKLSDFLAKYLKVRPPGEVIRVALIEVVKEKLNVALPPESIRIDRATAFIQASSNIKTELFMRKAEIIAAVAAKNPAAKLSDIR